MNISHTIPFFFFLWSVKPSPSCKKNVDLAMNVYVDSAKNHKGMKQPEGLYMILYRVLR